MNDSSKDPSIHAEPHLRGDGFRPDPSEERVGRTGSRDVSEDQQIEHSVWDEPGLSVPLVGDVPPDALTYGEWLQRRCTETTFFESWTVTFGIALLAGPWALVHAFLGAGQTVFGILAVTVFGPVVEEMVKVGLVFYVIEKKPYLFRSAFQIGICVLAGGLAFSVIENFLYLKVYIADPSPGLVRWRWTICVCMHMGCSLIMGLGLIRIWRTTFEKLARPNLSLGFGCFVTAFVLHGTYNSFAVLLDAVDFRF